MLVHEHTPRAQEHAHQAAALLAIGSEWAAVAYFYGAYHRARAALRSDPIFNDLTKLKTVNANLLPYDRDATAHHGRRKPSVSFGVNDLVQLLYPAAWPDYTLLHQASIQVRYQTRLFIDLSKLGSAHGAFVVAHDSGALRY